MRRISPLIKLCFLFPILEELQMMETLEELGKVETLNELVMLIMIVCFRLYGINVYSIEAKFPLHFPIYSEIHFQKFVIV